MPRVVATPIDSRLSTSIVYNNTSVHPRLLSGKTDKKNTANSTGYCDDQDSRQPHGFRQCSRTCRRNYGQEKREKVVASTAARQDVAMYCPKKPGVLIAHLINTHRVQPDLAHDLTEEIFGRKVINRLLHTKPLKV
jgi:hypothetical protein